MRRWQLLIVTLVASAFGACGGVSTQDVPPTSLSAPPTATPAQEEQLASAAGDVRQAVGGSDAEVIRVSISGIPGSYSFSVTVRSPDAGCEKYADWWEVVTPEGQLIYRRVLLHSHVGEQPFTRSGGPVKIQPDETVIVRAHMNIAGYGKVGFSGAVASGLTSTELPRNFGADLEERGPLPSSCAF